MKGKSEFPHLLGKARFTELPAPCQRNTLSHRTRLLSWSWEYRERGTEVNRLFVILSSVFLLWTSLICLRSSEIKSTFALFFKVNLVRLIIFQTKSYLWLYLHRHKITPAQNPHEVQKSDSVNVLLMVYAVQRRVATPNIFSKFINPENLFTMPIS